MTCELPVSDIAACVRLYRNDQTAPRDVERKAVKQVGALLEARAPGNSVEVRVPPYLALQVVEGVRHRRGTPPASVECNAQTFIELAVGVIAWADARAAGRLFASGERSDLSQLFPLLVMPPV